MQPYRFNEPTLFDRNHRPTVDGWNRLVQIVRKSGDALTPVAEYTYDGLYRRITKKVGIGNPVIHPYYSDRWKCLEEREDSGTDAVAQYVWGQRSNHRDELILRDRDTTANGTLDERLYALMDYFNCTSVVDTSGTVQERYGYSAFGVRRVMAADFSSRASSSFGWEFAFQGQFLDLESGYLNYGYRYYVPLIGRWVKRDLIGEEGGVNVYGFVGNNPLLRLDVLGKEGFTPAPAPGGLKTKPPTDSLGLPPTINGLDDGDIVIGYSANVDVFSPCKCDGTNIDCGEARGNGFSGIQGSARAAIQTAINDAAAKAKTAQCSNEAACGCGTCKATGDYQIDKKSGNWRSHSQKPNVSHVA